MWVFLLTEVLFFSGLFCAYAVFRRNHPELFVDGHHFLNTILGAINTAVLLLSSFTMAWGVRCAQLGKTRGLINCLDRHIALRRRVPRHQVHRIQGQVGPSHGPGPGPHRRVLWR